VIHVEHNKDFGDGVRPFVFGAMHGGQGKLSAYTFRWALFRGLFVAS
jgi:hypothetical protein